MAQDATGEAAPGPGAEADGQPPRRVLVSVGALLLGMLLAALDQTIVATALPTIVSDLGGLNHLSWVVTAYLLAATAATPLWGKLGDQYGRKKLFQTAIVIFLAGSVLCGVAQDMPQLIGFRALQGLGGGGLMVLSMAIVGDLVPPRERGRYQGLFGAVFGATSVLGPLLGGIFTEHLSWRWVFYVNVPLGAVALVVIATALHLPARRTRHVIDHLGTFLIASVAACLVLAASLGGTSWAWGSPQIIGLAVLAVLLGAWFARVERRAAEPVLPLRLFTIRTFTLSAVISFVIGFAMFGAMTYLPTFLQVVRGISPTLSGVHMLPMVAGVLLASTLSGQLITRTGRWKAFPVAGTGVTAVGLLLLHRLRQSTGDVEMSLYFFVFGVGLGLVIQVLVLVVQNAVPYEDLGVATSGATFFRSIGASFGVAVFGTVFTSRLDAEITEVLTGRPLPPGADAATLEADPRTVAALPPHLREQVLGAYSTAITDVFLYAAPVVLLAFALAWFFHEDPLRGAVLAPDQSETYAGNPVERTSRDEAERALSLLGTRAGRREVYRDITARAGEDLLPASSWLLLRVRRHGSVEPARLAERHAVPLHLVGAAARELEERRLADRLGLELRLTRAGAESAERLSRAREETLAELLGDWWGPERPTDLAEIVHRLSTALCGSDGERPQHGARRPKEGGAPRADGGR
ncbi:DHA2 family efflux MFS transporter permease subunit [Streptomyces diastaticus]